jgi:phosphoenolpyruvate carboxykinase (ATP)
MAAIQRGDLRGTNRYENGILGTKSIVEVEGKPMTEWNVKKFYSDEQIANYIVELVKGRREWTEEIAAEGLKKEIIDAAERAFAIEKIAAKKMISVPEMPSKEIIYVSEEPLKRPRRPSLWRWR